MDKIHERSIRGVDRLIFLLLPGLRRRDGKMAVCLPPRKEKIEWIPHEVYSFILKSGGNHSGERRKGGALPCFQAHRHRGRRVWPGARAWLQGPPHDTFAALPFSESRGDSRARGDLLPDPGVAFRGALRRLCGHAPQRSGQPPRRSTDPPAHAGLDVRRADRPHHKAQRLTISATAASSALISRPYGGKRWTHSNC